MRTVGAMAGVIAAVAAQEKVTLKTYSPDSSLTIKSNSDVAEYLTQTWKQQIVGNSVEVQGTATIQTAKAEPTDAVWSQQWVKEKKDTANPPAAAPLQYNVYLTKDANSGAWSAVPKQVNTELTGKATVASEALRDLAVDAADTFLTTGDSLWTVSDAKWAGDGTANTLSFNWKRNLRSANPNFLFNEANYLTYATWSVGTDKFIG